MRVAILWIASLAGCGASSLGAARVDSGTASDAGGDGGGAGEDSAAAPPRWWTLSGTLELADGAPRRATVALQVEVLDDEGAVLCAGPARVAAVESLALPDPALFGWWGLDLGAWSPTCAEGQQAARPYPDTLELGVGVLHPEIEAALPSVDGLSGSAWSRLNAAYARLDPDGELVVYGLAGPPEAYAGTAGPWLAAPLPDGTVELRAIYRFGS